MRLHLGTRDHESSNELLGVSFFLFHARILEGYGYWGKIRPKVDSEPSDAYCLYAILRYAKIRKKDACEESPVGAGALQASPLCPWCKIERGIPWYTEAPPRHATQATRANVLISKRSASFNASCRPCPPPPSLVKSLSLKIEGMAFAA